jgi:type II secretory pathway pseudopilin PulG
MSVKSLETRVQSQMRRAALRWGSGSRLSTLDSRLRRSAMTLIELLAVIVIITTLVAAAIPLMSPTNDDRRIREATRGLNTDITGAQARAVGSHRPFGIALKRLSQDTKRNDPTKLDNDNGACLEVFYVEQPAPYSGFDANSRACVALYPDQNARPGLAIVRFLTRGTTGNGMPTGWSADLFPSDMIRPGDVIEVNGTQFALLNDTGLNTNITVTNISQDSTNLNYYFEPPPNKNPAQILAVPLNDSGQQIYPKYDNAGFNLGTDREASAPAKRTGPYWTNPEPYKILRQAAIASDEPYQLPEGTAIDLRASGVGGDSLTKFFHCPGYVDNDEQIQIMFTPEGRVARVNFNQKPLINADGTTDENEWFGDAVVDNVYLLVGRRDRIPPPPVAATGTPHDSTLNLIEAQKAGTDEQKAKLKEPLNWLSGNSRWVVIGSQSGRVATIENANVDMVDVLTATPPPQFPTAAASTEDMRAVQILSAREFTREMKQVGGR